MKKSKRVKKSNIWKVKINKEAYNNANHVWSKWSINTDDSKHILTSIKHPYCVIKRQSHKFAKRIILKKYLILTWVNYYLF